MCFQGVRSHIQSQADVYKFLADDDERSALLRRQENYREFEDSFLRKRQDREYTDDTLGYVSTFEIDDLRIGIIGLNSSWLSEGGASDEGRLLVGESQVKSAIDMAARNSPHLVLSLQHHPFDLLRRFDQRPVRRRLEDACDFIHCGHMHDPEVTEAVAESGRCITITAGASFQSRIFRNTYTSVEFDPLTGEIEVAFIEYNPQTSEYEYESKRNLRHKIVGPCLCTVEELAQAIGAYCSDADAISGYLSSLLLGWASDVPIVSDGAVAFGNWDSADGVNDASFRRIARDFRGVGRVVRLLHGRKPLADVLGTHGVPVRLFARWLKALSEKEPFVKEYLEMQNGISARHPAPGDSEPLRHSINLLMDLMEADDWDGARRLAERTIDVSEGASRVRVARSLAFCLARSTEERDRRRAIELYREVVKSELAEPADWAALATLLTVLNRYGEAEVVIRGGISRFPTQAQQFVVVGMRLVQECGDRELRNWLLAKGRGQQGD